MDTTGTVTDGRPDAGFPPGCAVISISAGGVTHHVPIPRGIQSDAEMLQGVIDGKPGAVYVHFTDEIKYDAESDRLIFYSEHERIADVSRALVAPKLAAVLGLRQPTDLGAKPARKT